VSFHLLRLRGFSVCNTTKDRKEYCSSSLRPIKDQHPFSQKKKINTKRRSQQHKTSSAIHSLPFPIQRKKMSTIRTSVHHRLEYD
jgi:hypothetical protein